MAKVKKKVRKRKGEKGERSKSKLSRISKAKIKAILEDAYAKINFDEKVLKPIVEKIKREVEEAIGGKAKVVVGGSYAKGTMVKKAKQDIDLFLVFSKPNDISKTAFDALKGLGVEILHGSRDYFLKHVEWDGYSIDFEFVPVLKLKKGQKPENVIDISPYHVAYVKKELSARQRKEVKLLKAFVEAIGCYGAESYVRGFSGYSLELLILAYGSFLGFCKKAAKWKPIVFIDLEGHYKNLQEALEHIDKAKLSPILLIDPVQKDRNVLAALSMENFLKVKKACMNFLKNPSPKFFEKKPVDAERIKQIAKRKKARFVAIHLLQEAKEDVARAKAVKFYKALMREMEKNCDVLHSIIDYRDDGASIYFVVREKKEIVVRGPPLELEQAVKAFKAKHKETFVKGKRIFAREKPKTIDKILSDVLAEKKSYKIKSCKVEIG